MFLYIQEYLARLGIDSRAPHPAHLSVTGSYAGLEERQAGYSRLGRAGLDTTDTLSEKNSLVSGGAGSVYARTGHPVSITGSLSR